MNSTPLAIKAGHVVRHRFLHYPALEVLRVNEFRGVATSIECRWMGPDGCINHLSAELFNFEHDEEWLEAYQKVEAERECAKRRALLHKELPHAANVRPPEDISLQ